MSNIITLPMATTTEALVLLKPGVYTGLYVRHEGRHVFQRLKLEVLFRLMEHPDLVLPRWYHVTHYKGRVSAPKHSDLVRELSAVLGQRVRHDRISVASIANIIVDVEVSTVKRDSRPQPLDPVNQYSVISRVMGRA